MMRVLARLLALVMALASWTGCAVLHHVQLGDMDGRRKLVPFDIKVSETGINFNEASDIAARFGGKRESEIASDIATILSLIQFGPRTGNGVFVERYADGMLDLIYKSCPSGRVSGLQSIRETRKYPVISGEIVKITGYCARG